MKKVIIVVCTVLILCGLYACNKKEDKLTQPETSNKKEENLTQLGTSKFYIKLPEGYVSHDDDFDEDQVAYYYKDDESIDFDVYQWSKEDEYTLESEAKYFAEQYGTTSTEVEINGIKGMKYISEEDYEGHTYTVLNYMFDDGEDIVEVCFWTINTTEEIDYAENIIKTLKKK